MDNVRAEIKVIVILTGDKLGTVKWKTNLQYQNNFFA